MAIPFLNNIDLTNNQLLNAKLQVTGTQPQSAPGQIYFDSSLDVALYHDNTNWVRIRDTTLSPGAFVSTASTGSGSSTNYTVDLSAGGTPSATTYLRGDNSWEPISAIPGTYSFVISDNATPTENTGIVAEDDTVQIAANADLTSLLTGGATASKVLTVGLKVDSGLGNANNYVLNQGTEVAAAGDTIPFNDYTPGATPPSTQTNIVKKTTFGTIPVDALTLVKQYIDDSVAGGLIYQGGYNADTNTPDLTTSPNSILKGWTYTVTADGTFFGEQLRVGDVLIAEVNDPSALTDWTTVQNNIDLASLTQVGIGNVNASTDQDKVGLYVSYSNGTANIGVDIDSLTQGLPAGDNTDSFLFYYDDTAAENKKITFAQLSTEINTETSFSGTIGDGSATSIRLEDSGAVAPNINHGLGTDSTSFMIQLVDVSSGETVYADVTRGAGGQVTIDFASAPAVDGIRVLIQKIG